MWEERDQERENLDILMDKIREENEFCEQFLDAIRKKLKNTFLTKYNLNWKASRRTKAYFIRKHEIFLGNYFETIVTVDSLSGEQQSCRKRPGRPRKTLEDSSFRTKKRKLDILHEQVKRVSTSLQVDSVPETSDDRVEAPISEEDEDDQALAFMDLGCTQRKEESLGGTSRLAKPLIRILMTIDDSVLAEFRGKQFILHVKWGLDGASAQQTIKQKWLEAANQIENLLQPLDASIVQVSMVPLRIVTTEGEILWINPTPNSTSYCRPVQFEFQKETTEYTMSQYEHYEDKIRQLEPFTSEALGPESKITYNLKCTMMDGKTCSALTEQRSSCSCNVCFASPKDMNHLEFVKGLPVNRNSLQFGLHPLHCRIRFMEFLLHLAYNMDFKEFYATTELTKIIKAARKLVIQKELYNETGLSVDIVKNGSGTTNDGNTSRRFFEFPDKIAKILQIDESIIRRFRTLLEILNCQEIIDSNKMRDFGYKLADDIIAEYGWYTLPPSIHKALIHGWEIVESLELSSGALSEEPLECNNKILKRARLDSRQNASMRFGENPILQSNWSIQN
ncbi:hypothetical protein QAD02_021032 [Eretmocerus hayati]|uniref:Uncharacterized protein n=1 Tax=Eretmocerus hayati TaxID=131215 RepID=A0ACC2PNR7_9HYME|nr:hypothetical protein QAD02_021032 [Eretmocerus hayati]